MTNQLNKNIILIISSLFLAVFIILLLLGYKENNINFLYTVNYMKFFVYIALFGILYIFLDGQYSKKILILLAGIGLLLWFWGIDQPYYWDGIQTVTRAKYILLGLKDRFSIIYFMLAGFYKMFGETVVISHLIIMIFGISFAYSTFRICSILANKFASYICLILLIVVPQFFILNKLIYMDMPLLAAISYTILQTLNYEKSNKKIDLIKGIISALFAITIKEYGVIVIPLMLLILKDRIKINKDTLKKLVILFTFIMLIVIPILWTQIKQWEDISNIKLFGTAPGIAGITIVPFNKYLGIQWIKVSLDFFMQGTKMLINSGLLLISLLSFLFSDSKKVRHIMLYSVIFLQSVLIIFRDSINLSNHTFPFFNTNIIIFDIIVFAILFIVILSPIIIKPIKYYINKNLLLLWIGVLIPLVVFSLVGKVWIENDMWKGFLDWRYTSLSLPFLVIIFSITVSRYIETDNKTKIITLGILSLIIITNIINSVALYNVFDKDSRAMAKMYTALNNFNTKKVYSHWPFYYQKAKYPIIDVDKFTWISDKYNLKDISQLNNLKYLEGIINDPNSNFLILKNNILHRNNLFDTFLNPVQTLEISTYRIRPLGISVNRLDLNDVMIYSSNSLKKYRKIDIGDENDTIIEQNGWYQKERWGGDFSFRWGGRKDTTILYLNSGDEGFKSIFFRAYSLKDNYRVKVYVNDIFINELTYQCAWKDYNILLPENVRKEGLNKIEFKHEYVTNLRESGISSDGRNLTAAYDWICIK